VVVAASEVVLEHGMITGTLDRSAEIAVFRQRIENGVIPNPDRLRGGLNWVRRTFTLDYSRSLPSEKWRSTTARKCRRARQLPAQTQTPSSRAVAPFQERQSPTVPACGEGARRSAQIMWKTRP